MLARRVLYWCWYEGFEKSSNSELGEMIIECKKVLPVLCPESSYKTLGIQECASAKRLWMESVLDGTRDSSKQQILEDLVEYCKLDTLAMVEIFNKLRNL